MNRPRLGRGDKDPARESELKARLVMLRNHRAKLLAEIEGMGSGPAALSIPACIINLARRRSI
jgi:hypothetical protein